MQAGPASEICIQVAAATEINPDFMTYWPYLRRLVGVLGQNKSRALNKHEKCTTNPYFAVWIGSVVFGYIA